MNVEIGAEAALFLEKEYINGIAVEVYAIINSSSFKVIFTFCFPFIFFDAM